LPAQKQQTKHEQITQNSRATTHSNKAAGQQHKLKISRFTVYGTKVADRLHTAQNTKQQVQSTKNWRSPKFQMLAGLLLSNAIIDLLN